MEKHLTDVKLKYFRIRGLTPKEFYIPDDVEKNWLTRHCPIQTAWDPITASKNTQFTPYNGEKFVMAAMCGRKKNNQKEIGCSTSHLYAMKQAIYSKTAVSRYALIVEDDVFFPFDVDFNVLAQSAPSGFGILQLFNSNQPSMKHIWEKYLRNHKTLWLRRNAASFEFWSTCAYLIDREVMKPLIDAVVYSRMPGVTEFKLVAGVTNPCTPKECCGANATDVFSNVPPCVYAPRGLQADSFLYAMTATYMLTVPLVTNGVGGNQSTFHQFHVELLHRKAFKQQRELVNEMLVGKVPPPPFAAPACTPLDTEYL
jgi:hypothetical protein